jgi:hypothetical protein
MELFHIVEDQQVILRANGVYRQAPLYQRAGLLYAKHGSGFIGLRGNNGTTVPNIGWEDISVAVDVVPARGVRIAQ